MTVEPKVEATLKSIKYIQVLNDVTAVLVVLVMLMCCLVGIFMGLASRMSPVDQWIGTIVSLAVFLMLPLYCLARHQRGFRQRTSKAYRAQIALSVWWCVAAFPVGTIFHGIALYYLLGDANTKAAFSFKEYVVIKS